MQNVSPGTENKESGRDVAEKNTLKNHVTVPGIVNVEQKHFTPGDLLRVGWNAKAGTGQPGYPSAKGGAAA